MACPVSTGGRGGEGGGQGRSLMSSRERCTLGAWARASKPVAARATGARATGAPVWAGLAPCQLA